MGVTRQLLNLPRYGEEIRELVAWGFLRIYGGRTIWKIVTFQDLSVFVSPTAKLVQDLLDEQTEREARVSEVE